MEDNQHFSIVVLLNLIAELITRGDSFTCFFDSNVIRNLETNKEEKDIIIKLLVDKNRFIRGPAGERADGFIAAHAYNTNSIVISNDIYTDYFSKYPWLNPKFRPQRHFTGYIVGNHLMFPGLDINRLLKRDYHALIKEIGLGEKSPIYEPPKIIRDIPSIKIETDIHSKLKEQEPIEEIQSTQKLLIPSHQEKKPNEVETNDKSTSQEIAQLQLKNKPKGSTNFFIWLLIPILAVFIIILFIRNRKPENPPTTPNPIYPSKIETSKTRIVKNKRTSERKAKSEPSKGNTKDNQAGLNENKIINPASKRDLSPKQGLSNSKNLMYPGKMLPGSDNNPGHIGIANFWSKIKGMYTISINDVNVWTQINIEALTSEPYCGQRGTGDLRLVRGYHTYTVKLENSEWEGSFNIIEGQCNDIEIVAPR